MSAYKEIAFTARSEITVDPRDGEVKVKADISDVLQNFSASEVVDAMEADELLTSIGEDSAITWLLEQMSEDELIGRLMHKAA
ncbi:hypothetical protein OE987_001521 [Vibrio cholerae]|nr:hypothetical protein [Vibrio cholerae]